MWVKYHDQYYKVHRFYRNEYGDTFIDIGVGYDVNIRWVDIVNVVAKQKGGNQNG